jgi:hypothetical protein
MVQANHSYALKTLSLGEKAKKDLAAYEKLTSREIVAVRFTDDLVEQARLLMGDPGISECPLKSVWRDKGYQAATP